jgi:hypothetical protein
MIPPFDDNGYLPPGIHEASLEEIEARFGRESELRRVQMESINWLVDLASRVGVVRLVVNGSFVTDKYEPNDVDCVLLPGPLFPSDPAAEAALTEGLPFLQLSLVEQAEFDMMVGIIYATDRQAIPKGMIEVRL